ncbi:RNA-guided endonuclease TnpB family protein [Pleurocapsa sp. PCC 7319]|uniref:RNA-guided endonuclease InsQ/TnpB family protein n=1 Tax=Pleurocapsa sp. PCC 7319 TaxID=118161 RepID=UPI0003471214|nr:RNA-guided endonuclease TnpB family protein [Pleurocapsa sp. PCC 7319]
MKTYKFKLYRHKKNKYLHYSINASASIYNHCIALHKRYYKMFGKHLNQFRLMKHIAKLRKRIKYWQQVGSQAVQDVIQRIEKAYQIFFKQHQKGTRPPNFKKCRKYKSFTLKQAGYKFIFNNKIKIGKQVFKFSLSRKIKGKVKTLTVKRNNLGELFLLVVTDYQQEHIPIVTGKNAGWDFGLKTFLTSSDSKSIESPLFFSQLRNKLKAANRSLSRKKKGSSNWYRAKDHLNRVYEQISHKRRDWFWKLANQLTDEYDVLIFEDLNLDGMKRLWGRKVSDLSLATFLEILETVATNKGKLVHYIDRFFPSSKTCSCCGYVNQKLSLQEREWTCLQCNTTLDRDANAAINIQRVGASTLKLGDVRQSQTAISV